MIICYRYFKGGDTMKNILGIFLIVFCLSFTLFFTILITSQSIEATAATLFKDNFDSYTPGTFPSSGGLDLMYSGAGSSYQYVDNSKSVSGSQSLHLVGSSCWASHAYHPLKIPSRITLEVNVLVDQIVSCGCTPALVAFGLEDPNLNTWGTDFGRIDFNCDGNLYAVQAHYDRSKDVLLIPYNAGKWYHIQVDVDLTARLFDVYIDGKLIASGIQILDNGTPTGVELTAGHGANPTVWFDDLTVFASTEDKNSGKLNMEVECPENIVVGNPFDIVITQIENRDSVPITIAKALVNFTGNMGNSISGIGIFGPFSRIFDLTVPPGQTLTGSWKIRIIDKVPNALAGKVAMATFMFTTSNYKKELGGKSCGVNVLK